MTADPSHRMVGITTTMARRIILVIMVASPTIRGFLTAASRITASPAMVFPVMIAPASMAMAAWVSMIRAIPTTTVREIRGGAGASAIRRP